MAPRPTCTAGPRDATSREIAGRGTEADCSVTYESHSEMLVLAAEELGAFFKDVAELTNNKRTELDITRNLTDQVAQVRLVLKEFGWTGASYIKRINNKSYIIFKGYVANRSVFTGTKYLVNNAKVVSYGLGRQAGTLFKGSFVSIIFVSALNVIETVISEDKDFIDATAQFTTDVAKTIAVAIAAAAASAVMSAFAAPVVLTVGTVAVVGIVVALVLDKIDAEFEITASLSEWLHKNFDESLRQFEEQKYQIKREWMWCNSPEGAMACMQQMFGG